jgi:hypothetical protein
MLSTNIRLFQTRKDDIVFSVNDNDNVVTIVNAKAGMPFVKETVYEGSKLIGRSKFVFLAVRLHRSFTYRRTKSIKKPVRRANKTEKAM